MNVNINSLTTHLDRAENKQCFQPSDVERPMIGAAAFLAIPLVALSFLVPLPVSVAALAGYGWMSFELEEGRSNRVKRVTDVIDDVLNNTGYLSEFQTKVLLINHKLDLLIEKGGENVEDNIEYKRLRAKMGEFDVSADKVNTASLKAIKGTDLYKQMNDIVPSLMWTAGLTSLGAKIVSVLWKLTIITSSASVLAALALACLASYQMSNASNFYTNSDNALQKLKQSKECRVIASRVAYDKELQVIDTALTQKMFEKGMTSEEVFGVKPKAIANTLYNDYTSGEKTDSMVS